MLSRTEYALLDSHCHLDIAIAAGHDFEQMLQTAHQAGVEQILQIATNYRSSCWNRDLAARTLYAERESAIEIYWTAGLHPEAVAEENDLQTIFAIARNHRDAPTFWGLGETGLDYFHTTDTIAHQKKSLTAHLEIARELGLPIVLHTRDDRSYHPDRTASVQDAFDICKRYPEVKGVLHCFTYTAKEALPFVRELGWFVSYSGVLTFKSARPVQAGACALPLENLLVETDAPYLAPVPWRGLPNQPAYVRSTAEFLVNLRVEACQEDPDQVWSQLTQNQERFLRLKAS
ncbi:MAG: TatD family hydrolase [Leptospiraceae bacterium]|nr:TatD family hydrolase [Leptospiraceae bacterium]